MPIALRILPVGEEALRRDEGEVITCPRHTDIE